MVAGEGAADGGLALLGGGVAVFEGVPEDGLGGHHRGGRVAEHGLGDLLGPVEEGLVADDLGDDAKLVGALGVDALVGAHEGDAHVGVEGDALGPEDLADHRGDAHADAGVEEGGVLVADDDVAVGDEHESAAADDAVDGADHGLADAVLPRRSLDAGGVGVALLAGGVALGRFLDVDAGAEGPVADGGEDRHTQGAVVLEVLPNLGHLVGPAGHRQGVHAMGAVDGDDGELTVFFVEDVSWGHRGCAPVAGWESGESLERGPWGVKRTGRGRGGFV